MKTQNPLIGRSKKSFGEATFYTMNGQNIVRTKAVAVANPNTPAQQMQRMRFTAFTEAANTLTENEINFLCPVKEPRQNRRSTFQQQIAPAYGAMLNPDPQGATKYVGTFDVTKLNKIGTGEAGYVGDLVTGAMSNNELRLTVENQSTLTENMVDATASDEFIVVVISEDGCTIEVCDTGVTIADVLQNIENEQPMMVTTTKAAGHGDSAYCYAVGGKLQLIGLGTFSVAERAARVGHNPRHNTPVSNS